MKFLWHYSRTIFTKGPYLGSFGTGTLWAMCAFSEECSFQKRLLWFSVDQEKHGACFPCRYPWSCACRLVVRTSLLCVSAVYAQLLYACLKLCMRAWGWGIPRLCPCSPWCGGGAPCRTAHTKKVLKYHRCRILRGAVRPGLEAICIRLNDPFWFN